MLCSNNSQIYPNLNSVIILWACYNASIMTNLTSIHFVRSDLVNVLSPRSTFHWPLYHNYSRHLPISFQELPHVGISKTWKWVIIKIFCYLWTCYDILLSKFSMFDVKEVSLCYIGYTAPTYRLPIMSMRSYTEPPHCYKIWEAHGIILSSFWPSHASGCSAIASHPFYGASGLHCRIKHKLAFRHGGAGARYGLETYLNAGRD